MLDWLKQNKRFINIRAIEQELKMYEGCLDKAVNGKRNLPDKWVKPLSKLINKLKS